MGRALDGALFVGGKSLLDGCMGTVAQAKKGGCPPSAMQRTLFYPCLKEANDSIQLLY